MRPTGLLAVAALLAAGSLVTSPAASLAIAACPAPLQALRDKVQQDDYTAGDAGDCPEFAREVRATATAMYHWATLDLAKDGEGVADLHDWFRVDLAAKFGVGEWIKANVSGDVLTYTTRGLGPLLPQTPVPVPAVPAVPHVPVVMDVVTPLTGSRYTVDSCGPGVALVVEPGMYLVHVMRPPSKDASPCLPEVPFPAAAGAPHPVHNYGFYYGCDPVCHLAG